MNAILSGQLSVAVLESGGLGVLIRLNEKIDLEIRPQDVPRIFADATDCVELTDTTREIALTRLAVEWKKDRCLILTLLLLSSSANSTARDLAAASIEHLLGEPEVNSFLLSRLFVSPFPDAADLRGALERATNRSLVRLSKALNEVQSYQSRISICRESWSAIPIDIFGGEDAKEMFAYALVDRGVFRRLARSSDLETEQSLLFGDSSWVSFVGWREGLVQWIGLVRDGLRTASVRDASSASPQIVVSNTRRPSGRVSQDFSGRQPACILLVDGNGLNRRLLRAMLKPEGYRFLEAAQPSKALEILNRETVDLVIVDQAIGEMGGPEFCHSLKKAQRTQLIPILMTTSVRGTESEVTGIASGADELLIKPLDPAMARTRIRGMLRNKAFTDSLEEAETILLALAQAVEHRDKYSGQHCQRLTTYSLALGQALGLPHQDQLALYRGSYLHDIGKIGIPDGILFKRGLLTDEEWQTMRLHTIRGEEICRPMKTLAAVLPIIRNHHERWDGSGYPDGLKGEEIPLLARIMQVADLYDALTTARPYKPAFSHQQVIEIMLEEASRGWRDPKLVPLFAEVAESAGGRDEGLLPITGRRASKRSIENVEVNLWAEWLLTGRSVEAVENIRMELLKEVG